MPELPEVESFKKYIDETCLHHKIEAVKLAAPELLLNTTARMLKQKLEANMFEETHRHGKFLFVKLKKHGYLMLHFGLTGDLLYYTPDEKAPKSYAVLIHFENGDNLAFTDPRKLGKISLIDDIQAFIKQRGYGKDALQVTADEFIALFQKKRVAIKTALMNQKLIAGVGNEFSDEILFQSGIHPESITNRLKESQLREIYRQMIALLKAAVKQNADRSKLQQYFFLENRKAGLKCPGCKGETAFKTIGGRSSYFCPSCQKRY